MVGCRFVCVVLVCCWAAQAAVINPPPFNCTSETNYPPPPTNDVTKLRPGNIQVVMAMGDSISAGFAMQGFPPQDFEEWRDYVFSIGGASDAYTLATHLQSYNPNIAGAAAGQTWPMTKGAWLDAGVSMARVQDLPGQVTYLVNTLKTQYAQQVDFNNDWKLLTLFIGANNLCGACRNDSDSDPVYWQQHLDTVLGLVEQQIPRVFVNLLTIFNISGVWDAGQTSDYCRVLWDGITNGECHCLTTGKKADRDAMDTRAQIFNAITQKLAAKYAAKKNPSFTVVVQPGLSGYNIAQFGEGYLSKLDCFHPNFYANQAFAYSIWNNMFQPAGAKQSTIDMNNLQPVICPTDSMFLQ